MNLVAILPEIVLCIGAFVLMVLDVALPRRGATVAGWLSVLFILLAALVVLAGVDQVDTGFSGMIVADRFANLFRLIIYLGALVANLTAVGSWHSKGQAGIFGAEFFALMLISIVGMDMLVIGAHMAVLFLGLEILSLPLYAMAAGWVRSEAAVEAGAKYFLNGAFASGFLLFGIALVYGATGSFTLEGIGRAVAAGTAHDLLVWIGGILIAVGFLFKMAAAPFHAWAPDVYAGAPTPTVAFFSAAPKAAAIGLLLRLTQTAFAQVPLGTILWGVAWLSMLIGNLWALRQRDLKRLLAYSGIAHVGYALVGLSAGVASAGAVGFYLLGYVGMAVGGFTVIAAVGRGGQTVTLDTISGLGRRQPLVAGVFTIMMFALAGIPPTVGFAGKFALFSEAVRAGSVGLVIWAVLFSALSVYYYLRVVVAMWMWPEPETQMSTAGTTGLRLALVLSALLCLIPGIYPQPFLEFAGNSIFWLR
ncbi:MAG: NADH-quinone oxidoreductase subunit N [candidate division Zixibacteria bacterium]|nr:NADH-quinone oxidoreductase subunit N [candidate division Zixibacteria bacterium]